MGWTLLAFEWLVTLPLWHIYAAIRGVHPIAYGRADGHRTRLPPSTCRLPAARTPGSPRMLRPLRQRLGHGMLQVGTVFRRVGGRRTAAPRLRSSKQHRHARPPCLPCLRYERAGVRISIDAFVTQASTTPALHDHCHRAPTQSARLTCEGTISAVGAPRRSHMLA